MKKIILFLLFTVIFYTCKNKKENDGFEKQLVYILNDSVISDCIYCTDTQALGGSCTCFTDVSVGSCTGKSAGVGKSNSYLVSCKDLTSLGNWSEIASGTQSCISATCPPEAYQAAFTQIGK